jgi:hypothetical protein
MHRRSLAVDLVRIALDGRNHVAQKGLLAFGVHTAHLADLYLAGLVSSNSDLVVRRTGRSEGELHPLVETTWERLEPRLPRGLEACFSKDVAPFLKSLSRVRRWIYRDDPAVEAADVESPDEVLRAQTLRALASIATIHAPPGIVQVPDGPDPRREEVNLLLRTMRVMYVNNSHNSLGSVGKTGTVGPFGPI